ncbi:general secretion pathway protein GspB [Pseudomonadales bacterium]|nr:general secretion pathway protein GspB [Pseudomonadales bacterium]
MSFILDAIKKSEDERQRSKQPDVHSLQNSGVYTVAPQRRFVRSFILLVALVMLIGICSWLWPQIQRQFTPHQYERGQAPLAQGSSIQNQKSSQAGGQKVTTTQVTNAATDADMATGSDVAFSTGQQSSNSASNKLPPRNFIKELWQMPADFQSTVPDLKFSFHVFSTNPEKRTIIINGRRMREGQMVSSQVKLRVITETGVICEHKGQYFHVDVVEKW